MSASGPDYLRYEEYQQRNPHVLSERERQASIWKRQQEKEICAKLHPPTWPSMAVIAPKVLAKIEAPTMPPQIHYCECCGRLANSKHHVIPRSEHHLRHEPKSHLNRCVYLCRRCHDVTHALYSNMCLAEMPWAVVAEHVRHCVAFRPVAGRNR